MRVNRPSDSKSCIHIRLVEVIHPQMLARFICYTFFLMDNLSSYEPAKSKHLIRSKQGNDKPQISLICV